MIRPKQPDDMRSAAVIGCVLLALMAITAAAAHGVDLTSLAALKAAGLNPRDGAIGGVLKFVNNIEDNLVWLTATLAGASIIAVGLLFTLGHSRAQDFAIRLGVGLLIVVAAPGIVA